MNTDKVLEHELCDLYSSANNPNGDQISEGPVASIREVRSVHGTSHEPAGRHLGKHRGKYEANNSDSQRNIGRPRKRWADQLHLED
jgi:hypothetical protein